jgi:5-(carboxyamino)imidazole ribonucleotide synthase
MRVGIVGGGQLGRMLALAAHPLGLEVVTLDPATRSPAAQVADAIVGAYDDEASLAVLAQVADVVTYEFENVPVTAAERLQARVPVRPAPVALRAAQDRLHEKRLFEEIGLPVAPYRPIDDVTSFDQAIGSVGVPALLKTRRFGYDGKGQTPLIRAELAEDAWRAVGEVPSILEAKVPFDRELSIVGARDVEGRTAFYPLVANEHREGILRVSRAPVEGLGPDLQRRAEEHATALMERLGYVGVLAIELFLVGDDLLGNEFAPRVHNSGHWTIEGAETSQFEQHLRAVAGWPLGSTDLRGHAALVNLIGAEPEPAAVLSIEGAHLHRYGKQAREGRKLGHVTVVAPNQAAREAALQQVLAALAGETGPARTIAG